MGERLLCKQEVIGSNRFTSTIGTSTIGRMRRWCATFGEAEETPPGARLMPGAGC